MLLIEGGGGSPVAGETELLRGISTSRGETIVKLCTFPAEDTTAGEDAIVEGCTGEKMKWEGPSTGLGEGVDI